MFYYIFLSFCICNFFRIVCGSFETLLLVLFEIFWLVDFAFLVPDAAFRNNFLNAVVSLFGCSAFSFVCSLYLRLLNVMNLSCRTRYFVFASFVLMVSLSILFSSYSLSNLLQFLWYFCFVFALVLLWYETAFHQCNCN